MHEKIDNEAWFYFILLFVVGTCGGIGIYKLTHNAVASIWLGITISGICYYLSSIAHSCRRLYADVLRRERRQWIPFSWKLEEETDGYGIFSTTETHDGEEAIGKFQKGDYRHTEDGKFELRIGSKVEWIKAPTG